MSQARKGARRIAEIPAATLAALSRGELPTVNLVEYLAVDLQQLLPAVAGHIGLDPQHPEILATLHRLPELKPMKRHWAIAVALHRLCPHASPARAALGRHVSDLARQWAALAVGLDNHRPLAELLEDIRPFAADGHFGVREVAWLALRDVVALDVAHALDLLRPWVDEDDANLRRFASELTRPRGVWCVHLECLKDDPAPGLRLLEPLRADPSRYVQNSVANWLNDAAKHRPEWVRATCQRWQTEAPGAATRYICTRGTRTLDKPPRSRRPAA